MTTNKGFLLLVVLALLVAGLVWGSLNEVSHAPVATLKVGVIAPLTGGIAVLGEHMRNGFEMAREDLVASGAVSDLQVIYEDGCDPTTSLNAARKLIDVDKVNIIGGSFCLVGLDAVVPVAEEKGVVVFNTAANPESVLNQKNVFSTNITIREDAYKMAEYASSVLKAKRVAVIHFDTSFGESYRDNFATKFSELGGEVVLTEAKEISASDFRTELTKIKGLKTDAIVIIHFGGSLGTAIKQTRELGIDVPIIGDYESEDQTVLDVAGDAAEGFVISSSQPENKIEAISEFEARYMEKYGELPDVLATNAYDALMLQAKTYTVCDGNTACVIKKLEETTGYAGVSGLITIHPEDHSVQKPVVFKVVRNGEFVKIEE